MSRLVVFWMMIGAIGIPALWLGWLRGRAIGRTYRFIYADLKQIGIELSKAELQFLIRQLYRNPKAVLNSDNRAESQAIKERHVLPFITFSNTIRTWRWILYGLGITAILLFPHFWPKK